MNPMNFVKHNFKSFFIHFFKKSIALFDALLLILLKTNVVKTLDIVILNNSKVYLYNSQSIFK